MFTNNKSTMNPQDYTIVQFKELLKMRNLSIVDNKVRLDLKVCLQEHDSEIWKIRRGNVIYLRTKSLL